jgi:hypothetical protein
LQVKYSIFENTKVNDNHFKSVLIKAN